MPTRPLPSIAITLLVLFGALFHSAPGLAQALDNWVETPAALPSEQSGLDSSGVTTPSTEKKKRSWLVQQPSDQPMLGASPTATATGTTGVLAIALVLVLAGAAIWFKRRRLEADGPSAEVNARLAVLSTSRIGPKAYAVSVTAGGRVMLLGVTDQSVNHLAWLDEPSPDALLQAAGSPAPPPLVSAPAETEEDDSLPDDYPGSALRAQQAATPLANSQDLARFQKLLQGAVEGQSVSIAPEAPATTAAAQLASRTQDIVGSTASALAGVAPVLSLRRKRQRRRANTSVPPNVSSRRSQPAPSPEPAFEGQVAGLKALKNH